MVSVGVLRLAFWDSTWEYKHQMASANSHVMLPDDFLIAGHNYAATREVRA